MSNHLLRPSWKDPLPGEYSRAVLEKAGAVAGRSLTGAKGAKSLGPDFAALTMRIARLRQLPITEEEADKLGGYVAYGLEKVDLSIQITETVMARIRILFPAAFLIKMSKTAAVFFVYGRALAHTLLLAKAGSLTVEEIARIVLGIGTSEE